VIVSIAREIINSLDQAMHEHPRTASSADCSLGVRIEEPEDEEQIGGESPREFETGFVERPDVEAPAAGAQGNLEGHGSWPKPSVFGSHPRRCKALSEFDLDTRLDEHVLLDYESVNVTRARSPLPVLPFGS
jgi:hypothetical protein